jgi:HEAT repeat protein
MAVEVPGVDLLRLIRAGLQSRDPLVRLWATRRLPTLLSGQQLEEALAALGQDSSMLVRRQGLAVRIEALPSSAVAGLEGALLDSNPAVREFARFYLRRFGREVFAPFYRRALADETRQAAAVAGLGETGTREDAALLLPFLGSPERRERCAAVRAIGMLAGDDYHNLLVDRLGDESLKVVREAQQALEGRALLIDAGRLWAAFTTDRRLVARLAALALLGGGGRWRNLPYLIRAATDPEEVVARRSRNYIVQGSGVYTRPNAEERRQIQDALDECSNALDPTFLAALRRWIG